MEGVVSLTYTNWIGRTSVRHVVIRGFWFGRTEWHPEEQWFMKALDTERNVERDFALLDCDFTRAE